MNDAVRELSLPSKDIWQQLAEEKRPILLYGMGNGADKILAALAEYGIPCADVFASDAFVRGQSFHQKKVLTYAQAKEKYTNFVVLVAFGSARPDVLDTVWRIQKEQTLYIPDVPVATGPRFDLAFALAHQEELAMARALFCEEASRTLFDRMVTYKLTADPDLLWTGCTTAQEDFSFPLTPASYQTILDVGAYNGDTISELLGYAKGIKRILAMEPDVHNHQKLCARAQREGFADRLLSYPYVAWSSNTMLSFLNAGNRNAGVLQSAGGTGAKYKTQSARTIDSLFAQEKIDYIKYDVEGAEHEALLGSQTILAQQRPQLCVSAYHRSEDLFDLPLLLQQIRPDYRFYLRRRCAFPAWDINLYAV